MLKNKELVIEYLPLVKTVAYKFWEKSAYHHDFDDLVGYGNIALIKAVDSFNPNKGNEFRTYLWNKIYYGIIDGLRRNGFQVRSNRTKNEDGSYNYNTPKFLEDVLPKDNNTDDYNYESIENLLPDNNWEVSFYEMEKNNDYQLLYNKLKTLSDKEQTIVDLYFFKNMTLKQVGQNFKLGEAWACVRVKKIINKLKDNFGHELIGLLNY